MNGEKAGEIRIKQGGVRTLLVRGNGELGYEPRFDSFLLTSENSVHMLWIVPQYLVITIGEIMFSVTGLEFSCSQVSTPLQVFSIRQITDMRWLVQLFCKEGMLTFCTFTTFNWSSMCQIFNALIARAFAFHLHQNLKASIQTYAYI